MATSSSARRLVLALVLLAGCREASISGTEITDRSGFPRAVRLGFSGQPENGLTGLPIVGAVVTAYDSAGNIAFGFNGPITIGLADSAASAVLGGTITVNAADGIARFTALRISGAGHEFTLRAVADGLVPATSNSLDVVSLGERVAFISDRDGPQAVYVANADGSGIARLTSDTSSYREPAWSPDGARIAVTRAGDGIWVLDADGTHARQLAHDGFAPAWNADCTRIRFARPTGRDGAQTEIDEASATGSDVVRIAVWPLDFRAPVKLAAPAPHGSELHWSPDLSRVAFTSVQWMFDANGDASANVRVKVMNADGTNLRSLTPDTDSLSSLNSSPAWSPDGSHIALLTLHPLGAATIAADGSEPLVEIVVGSAFDDVGKFVNAPSWLPDGRSVALVRGLEPHDWEHRSTPSRDTTTAVWISDAAGMSSPRRLAKPIAGWDLAWAP